MRARLVAALVAAALAVGACGGEPRPTLSPERGTGPAPSSTVALPQIGDVHAAIRRGLSSLQSFRAEVLGTTSGASRETRVTVERTARGLMKDIEATPGVERTFFDDGQEGRHVFHYAPESGRPTARVQTGVPVGVRTGYGSPLQARGDPVALARQVLDWDDARVSRDTVDGRAAWVVQRSTPGVHPELQVVTIDDQTGLALRADALHAGQPEYQIRVQNLTLNLAVEPAVTIPEGVPVTRMDLGYVRASLDQVRRAVGYTPVLPTWLPDGFSQAELAYTLRTEGRGRNAVAVAFRRGMDLTVVTTYLEGTATPLATRPPSLPPPKDEGLSIDLPRLERVTLAGGAFGGAEAERPVNSLGGVMRLSAANDSLVLEIRGDLTKDEMIRLAESLQPAR